MNDVSGELLRAFLSMLVCVCVYSRNVTFNTKVFTSSSSSSFSSFFLSFTRLLLVCRVRSTFDMKTGSSLVFVSLASTFVLFYSC